jgi:hypothetical protein
MRRNLQQFFVDARIVLSNFMIHACSWLTIIAPSSMAWSCYKLYFRLIGSPIERARLEVFVIGIDVDCAFEKHSNACQGCHNGQFWMKMSVRTSAHVRIYPL